MSAAAAFRSIEPEEKLLPRDAREVLARYRKRAPQQPSTEPLHDPKHFFSDRRFAALKLEHVTPGRIERLLLERRELSAQTLNHLRAYL